MSGTVALSIIKPSGEYINNITYTGAEQNLFFSPEYITGNYEKAIEQTIVDMAEYKLKFLVKKETANDSNCLAPYSYGLIVVDFTKKIIRSMQNYNTPSHKDMINYYNDFCNNRNMPFMDLSSSDNLLIKDVETDQTYTLKEFFGSTDPKQILKIMKYVFDNRHIANPKKEFEEFKHFKIFSYDNPLFNNQLKIIPKNFDYKLITYTEKQAPLFIKDLAESGYLFNQYEIDEWIKYNARFLISDMEEANPDLEDEDLEVLALTNAKAAIENILNTNHTNKIKLPKKKKIVKNDS